jgi:hypothetical protein
MDLLSYKVIALILEPYRNAVARGNNAKSTEEPVKEPAMPAMFGFKGCEKGDNAMQFPKI